MPMPAPALSHLRDGLIRSELFNANLVQRSDTPSTTTTLPAHHSSDNVSSVVVNVFRTAILPELLTHIRHIAHDEAHRAVISIHGSIRQEVENDFQGALALSVASMEGALRGRVRREVEDALLFTTIPQASTSTAGSAFATANLHSKPSDVRPAGGATPWMTNDASRRICEAEPARFSTAMSGRAWGGLEDMALTDITALHPSSARRESDVLLNPSMNVSQERNHESSDFEDELYEDDDETSPVRQYPPLMTKALSSINFAKNEIIGVAPSSISPVRTHNPNPFATPSSSTHTQQPLQKGGKRLFAIPRPSMSLASTASSSPAPSSIPTFDEYAEHHYDGGEEGDGGPQCKNCAELSNGRRLRSGRCDRCYQYLYIKGVERPPVAGDLRRNKRPIERKQRRSCELKRSKSEHEL
ncbi:hypothetical protein SeLEV6574_g07766 [Synchytrium endobioticum]|uniref:Uncharacterized protein n=1 Tax=Synchytrium endobioticum TaxID=286115 RepID=A0A507CKU8_9FUNG|nr:hypothetical protein SeLEV6574_g07766 [Synchytrium endobioticum]